MNLFQSMLHPGGSQAAHIERLWWLFVWTTAIVFVLVIGATVLAVLRASRRAGPPVDDERRETRMGRIVAGAVLATTAILFVLLVSSVSAGRLNASLGAPGAVTIALTGHQWWWEVEYEDAVPSRRVKTANEIHVPTGRPIAIKVTSTDVIHSFWVPNLQGKRDLIPGYQTAIWLQADSPGRYRGQCAEFCGRQHANMALDVVAQPPAEFEKWIDHQRVAPDQPSGDEERYGQEIFLSRQCVGCHTVLGTPAHGQVGPDLTHVATRPTIAAGTLPNTRDHLAKWVVNAQAIKPGSQMPPNALAAPELQAVIAYLETLK
jgi:cytochrome c oxidase subunit II